MKLIVGLGNPGRQYSTTRHNVGFMVIDELAKRHHIPIKKRAGRSVVGVGKIGEEEVILAKPRTFMNLSGEAVSHLSRRYHIKADDIVVVCDDFALPPGKIRIRQQGSAGGHNGMKSIIHHLHTLEFPRVRVGIGSVEDEAVDYVLSRFTRSELLLIKPAIQNAASVVEVMLTEGVETAMNKFNAGG